MKKLNVRRMGSMFLVAMMMVAFVATPAFATGANFDSIMVPLQSLTI